MAKNLRATTSATYHPHLISVDLWLSKRALPELYLCSRYAWVWAWSNDPNLILFEFLELGAVAQGLALRAAPVRPGAGSQTCVHGVGSRYDWHTQGTRYRCFVCFFFRFSQFTRSAAGSLFGHYDAFATKGHSSSGEGSLLLPEGTVHGAALGLCYCATVAQRGHHSRSEWCKQACRTGFLFIPCGQNS